MLQRSSTLAQEYRRYLEEGGLDLAFADREPERFPDPFARGGFDPEAAKRIIRKLEAARGYADWLSVGSEPTADYLYRLGTVRSRGGPYLGDRLPALQGVLDAQAAMLGEVLADGGSALPFEVYAGVYPTGELNARVEAVPGGALVLVNAGLMDLLFCVLKLNLATSGDTAHPPPLSDDKASMALAEVLNAYLYAEGSLQAWSLPRLDPQREVMLGRVLRAAECFVLAHELGHVALGHLAPAEQGAAPALTPDAEVEADAFALDLLLRAAGPDLDALAARQLGGGALTSLLIAKAVLEAAAALGRPAAARASHPATDVRLERLAATIAERLPGTAALAGASVFSRWLFERHLPEALRWLRAVDEAVKRPGKWDL